MHGFAVVQGHDPEDTFLAVAGVGDLAPEADAAVGLGRAAERGGPTGAIGSLLDRA